MASTNIRGLAMRIRNLLRDRGGEAIGEALEAVQSQFDDMRGTTNALADAVDKKGSSTPSGPTTWGTAQQPTGFSVTLLTPKLPDGQYIFRASWLAHAGHATAVTYSMYAGGVLLGTAVVNQRNPPTNNLTLDGIVYQNLGTYTLNGSRGPLEIRVTNTSGDGLMICDAVVFSGPGSKNLVQDDPALTMLNTGVWWWETLPGYLGGQALYSSVQGAEGRYASDFGLNPVPIGTLKFAWTDPVPADANREDYVISSRRCDQVWTPIDSYSANMLIELTKPGEDGTERPWLSSPQFWEFKIEARNKSSVINESGGPTARLVIPINPGLRADLIDTQSLQKNAFYMLNGQLAIKTTAGMMSIGNGGLQIDGVPMDKALAGTYDAALFQSVAGQFKAKISAQFSLANSQLEIQTIDAGLIKTGNLLVGNITGVPAGVFAYKFNPGTGQNDLVAWFGHNGSIVGGWAKEFYVGGTNPATAKVYVDAGGNAVFSGSILSSAIASSTIVLNLNGITTTIGNVPGYYYGQYVGMVCQANGSAHRTEIYPTSFSCIGDSSTIAAYFGTTGVGNNAGQIGLYQSGTLTLLLDGSDGSVGAKIYRVDVGGTVYTGADGSFTSADGKTVTVRKGLITSIV
jgi:hypothetical protein